MGVLTKIRFMMDQQRTKSNQDEVGKSMISWEAFNVCVSETFRNLISDTDFTDVTLVCEDEKQIDAHKVILSNASKFFRRVLVRNPHPKPMLYLNGFSYEEVKSLIEFIYLGQTEICEDNISRFIAIAVDLEIKGIDENVLRKEMYERALDIDKQNEQEPYLDDVYREVLKKYNKGENEIGKPKKDNEAKAELKSAKIDENVDASFNDNDRADEESFSQFKSAYKKAGHYQCNPCEKTFFHKSVLQRHNKIVHEGLRYPCHLCDYKATQQQSLKRHTISKHSF